MVIALIQFSGTPNTEQFRLAEFLALCSNTAITKYNHHHRQSTSSNNSQQQQTHDNHLQQVPCTCCCHTCQDTTRTNSTFSLPHVRILGGCPVLCDTTHPRRTVEQPFATACCSRCHQISSRSRSILSLTPQEWQIVCARTFASFMKNECPCLFVELPSLDFLRRVVESAMLIAGCWIVGGAASDGNIPNPGEKTLSRSNNWNNSSRNDDDDSIKQQQQQQQQQQVITNKTGTYLALDQSRVLAELHGAVIDSSSSSSLQQPELDFFCSTFRAAKTFAYNIQYATASKYGNDYARDYVNTQLVPHPTAHVLAQQQYSFRDPDATLLMFIVPSADLPTQRLRQQMQKLEADLVVAEKKRVEKNKNDDDGNDAGALSSRAANAPAAALDALTATLSKVDPQPNTTFYLHCVQFATSPRSFLMSVYSVKHRRYIGTTTMVPELTFLMANCARVKRGDVVLDPFCGTGSIPMAARHLGAHQVIGFDIDGRVMRRGTRDSNQSLHSAKIREEELRKKLPLLWSSVDAKRFASHLPVVAGGEEAIRKHIERTLGSGCGGSSSSSDSVALPPSMPQNFDDFGLGFGPNCFVGSFSAFSKSFGSSVRSCSSSSSSNNGHSLLPPCWLDAIVTDPPYGIRETKRMTEHAKPTLSNQQQQQQRQLRGNNDNVDDDHDSAADMTNNQQQHSSASAWHQPLDNHPLYEATELLVDLVYFAAMSLVPGGRLVFWMSVTSYDYCEGQIPKHPWIRVVSNIPQQLNAKTVRRLIIMEKEGETAMAAAAAAVAPLPTRQDMLKNTMRGLELREAIDLPVPLFASSSSSAAASAGSGVNFISGSDAVFSGNDRTAHSSTKTTAGAPAAAAGGGCAAGGVSAAPVVSVDPDVARNMEKALRKKEERDRKNEAAALWRVEHGMQAALREDSTTTAVATSSSSSSGQKTNAAAAAGGGGGGRAGVVAGRKAENRERNVQNRQKNVDKKRLQEAEEEAARSQKKRQQQQQGALSLLKNRVREEQEQPSSSAPPRGE